jgi:hypothetical protein
MFVAKLGYVQLGSDAVGRGDKDRISELARTDGVKAAESSDIGKYAPAKSRGHDVLYSADQLIALVYVYAGLAVPGFFLIAHFLL